MCTIEFLYDMNYTNCFTFNGLSLEPDSTYINLIRDVLLVLGEMLTLVLLESHETPRVLFGAELHIGKLTVATLNQIHAWSLSEALGIRRYEASRDILIER